METYWQNPDTLSPYRLGKANHKAGLAYDACPYMNEHNECEWKLGWLEAETVKQAARLRKMSYGMIV